MQPVFLTTPSLLREENERTSTDDPPNIAHWSEKVTIRYGRAFIPLASSGCGVGCKYCYITRPDGVVSALSVSRMRELLQIVEAYMDKRPKAPRPILAIGCDTEIGMSQAVLDNAMICLEFAAKYRLPVQISTKFPLAWSLRQKLDNWPLADSPPVVFTTITTVSLSARLEPNAPSPAERSTNFGQHSPSWLSYALIKPFFPTSRDDKLALLELLTQSRPDGIVVGVRYRHKEILNVVDDVHPIANDWVAVPPTASARQFVMQLTGVGFRVFMNTQCVSAWINASSHGIIVKKKYPHLCVNCGNCP